MAVFNMTGAGGSGSGTDTSDATAYAENIEDGYTAYARGVKLTGTLKNSFLRFRSKVLPADYSCPTATAYNIIIPADTAEGDLIVIGVMHRDTITPPTGFTLIATQLNSDKTQYTSIYYKMANSTDANTAITFTQATSVRLGAELMVFEIVGGTAVLDSYSSSTNTSSPITFPSLTAASNKSVCVCVTAEVYSPNTITFTGTHWKSIDGSSATQRIGAAYEYVDAGNVDEPTITHSVSSVSASTIAAVFKIT